MALALVADSQVEMGCGLIVFLMSYGISIADVKANMALLQKILRFLRTFHIRPVGVLLARCFGFSADLLFLY